MFGNVDDSVIQQLLFRLPKEKSMLFVYLCSFFRELLLQSEMNELTPELVTDLLVDCLIGDESFEKALLSQRSTII